MPDQESTTPWARETPGRIAVQYGRFARIANKMTVERIVTKGSAVVSSQTSQAEVQSLIDRAVKLGDPKLAADIRQFASTRQYGLVFEHNRPERMRLYGKPVTARDVVQVLPRRGTAESAENRLLWRISALHDGKADLYAYVAPDYADNDGEPRTVDVADLVAVSEYDQPIYAGLRETGRVERGGDKPYQVVINGENYHALEALAFAYAGKVDCIYIDPPYNTGAKDWKYNNDYVDGSDQYRHSKWLAFMERRLRLAKRLLNPADSVLIVTIDEKEYLRLGLLLEQVFPGERIQMVTSVISRKGSVRHGNFTRKSEYIYFVMLGNASPVLSDRDMSTGELGKQKQCWRGLTREGASGLRTRLPSMFYPIFFSKKDGSYVKCGDSPQIGVDRDSVPVPEGCFAVWPALSIRGQEQGWRLSQKGFNERLAKGFVRFGPWKEGQTTRQISYAFKNVIEAVEAGKIEITGHDENGAVQLAPVRVQLAPPDIFSMPSHDASPNGTNLLHSIMPMRSFPYPKSLYAVYDCLRLFVADKPDALIVDFFAGSGTTLHAINLLNAVDSGRRHCVCVTNNEVSAADSQDLIKQGYRQGDKEWEDQGIAQNITWPRTRCSILGVNVDGAPLDGNYGCLTEAYLEAGGNIIDADTGKTLRGKVFKKGKQPTYPALAKINMADGFKENAVFYDLTYQDPTAVRLGMAFREVAPLLWLRAGARGRCIMDEKPNWDIADTYAVLFDPSRANAFVSELAKAPHVGLVYVVTDDERRFASVSAMLGGLPAVRLYADYLRSFRISAEGANN